MANRKILFALLVLCLSLLTECGRFGGRSSSGGSRGGSWGKSWGGSSSSSHSSWGSSYKPSSSWNSGSSSGSSWSKPSYPSSSSGLSGSSWSKPSYPSSSSGLSGSGSHSWKKPSTSWSSGSGSGSHSYPSSSTGLSGSGSGSRYPSSSGSGSHSYPSSTGLSGGSRYPSTSSGSSYGNKPHYNFNTGRYDTHSYHYIPQTYHTAPQHVYVTQYRNSDSRYGDLLTGLTLYNMGRSHSHYHDHYYYDDYYRHRYNENSYNNYNNGNNYHQTQSTYSKPKDEATCSLWINNNEKLEILKIPCEIVSTFTEGGRKVTNETQVNTKCTSYFNSIPNPFPDYASNVTLVNVTMNTITQLVRQTLTALNINDSLSEVFKMTENTTLNTTTTIITSTSAPIKTDESTTNSSLTNKTDNTYIQFTTTVTDKQIIVGVSTCSNHTYTDPLSVKGGPLTAFDKMECLVDIRTKDAYFQNPVDCKTLMEYSKMPEPKQEDKPLLPSREKLESWMEKPPWWLAMFIAV